MVFTVNRCAYNRQGKFLYKEIVYKCKTFEEAEAKFRELDANAKSNENFFVDVK